MDLSRLHRAPDDLSVDLGAGFRPLAGSGVTLDHETGPRGLRLVLAAPAAEPCAVRLRWHLEVPEGTRCLGDAWERGYGDLEWRGLVPERPMPWYVLLHGPGTQAGALHGIGVATGGAAFAFWQVDEAGLTLVLDVRSGGAGVRLGARRLDLATVIVRAGTAGEDEFAAAHAFCRLLCPAPRLPDHPVYGINDWYFAYGKNTAAELLREAATLAELSAGLATRPYAVIDAGWSGGHNCAGGPWPQVATYGDMAALAAGLAALDVRPGIWVRPLLHSAGPPPAWTVDAPRWAGAPGEVVLDPSVPEVLAQTETLMRTLNQWGYRLIKHDFTTFDLCGRWGNAWGDRPTQDGWRLRNDGITTAEAILGLYRAIRRGAGDSLVIGCNTVGHLAAGLIELSRTGDDTSGKAWERTRRMGINTLAMRMPQHGAFFAVDADCVGLTTAVDWSLNRQWLDVLARSGTPLFVSADPAAVGPEQRAALRTAFAAASRARAPSRPLDWRDTTQPRRWRHADGEVAYRWQTPSGATVPCSG
jgi:alpha-galactosidase